MKSVACLGTLALALLPPAIADVSTGNPKFCTSTNSQGISCKMSVRILCMMDDEGEEIDCLNPDQDNETPFAMVPNPIPNGYCGKKPVTIKFKVCNRNKNHPIRISDRTWIKYNKEKSTWEESKKWLGPNKCKVYTIHDEWDRCEIARGGKGSSKLMEAQLAARIIQDPKDWSNNGPNAYCYCYLFKAARVEFAELPPVETCETPADFRITEVVHGKYIEIYSTLCAKKQIVDDSLYLVRIPFGKSTPVLDDAYSLKAASDGSHGSYVPADGFFLACDSSAQSAFFNCDTGKSGEYLRQRDGKDTYAIIQIREGGDYDIIDVYGALTSGSTRIHQDLGDNGRAVRRNEVSAGISRFWQASEWYIRLNSIGNMDPRVWQNVPEDPIPFIITEIINPSTSGQSNEPPKYIEIYTERGKGGMVEQPIQLIIFPATSNLSDIASDKSVIVVDLQGLLVSSDGFMVICNSKATQMYDSCDINIEQSKRSNLPLVLNGSENVALIRGDISSGEFEILDMYGSIGGIGINEHKFANSRVVRNKRMTITMSPMQNSGIWNVKLWFIFPYKYNLATLDPADPHKWDNGSNYPESTKAPTSAPINVNRNLSPPPSPAPKLSPSKGKGKNKPSKQR